MNTFLRAVEPEDLDLMYVIENDPLLWGSGHAPAFYSHYELKCFIDSESHDFYSCRQMRFTIVSEGIACGFVDLQNFDPQNDRAEVGIALLPEQQHKGIATEAIRQLQSLASKRFLLYQLCALVPEQNEPSIRLFQRTGFACTATLSSWIKTNSNWQDVKVFQWRCNSSSEDKMPLKF